MKQKKENYYKPSTRKGTVLAATLAVLSLVIFSGFAFLSQKASDKRIRERALTVDYLCTTETPCLLRLEAVYDKEPMELYMVGPDGTEYDSKSADSYVTNADEKKITMRLYAPDLGKWNVKYNRLTNKKISFSIKQEYAEKLFLTDMVFSKGKVTGNYYLEFVPVYKDGSDTDQKVHCSVTIERIPGKENAGMVYEGEISINKKCRLQLDTKGYPDGDYHLFLDTRSLEAKNKKSLKPDTDDPFYSTKKVKIEIEGQKLESVSGNTVSQDTIPDDTEQEGESEDGQTGSMD